MSTPLLSTWHRPSGQQAYIALAILEALAAGPLAYALPFSTFALVAAVVLLVALNATLLTLVQDRPRAILLQGANLLVASFTLALLLDKGLRGSELRAALLIAAPNVIFLAVGAIALPSRSAKQRLAAQQFALAATSLSVLLTEPVLSTILSEKAQGYSFSRGDATALFLGPLGLVAVVAGASWIRWNPYSAFLAAICVAQLAIGCIGIGTVGGRDLVANVGGGLAIAFVVLLLLIFASEHRRVRAARREAEARSQKSSKESTG